MTAYKGVGFKEKASAVAEAFCSAYCLLPALRVDAALFGGVGHAVDGQHVGGDAVVDVVGDGELEDVVEAVDHDAIEALVDFFFGPEVAHAVLYPLEVAGGDASGGGEDVGDDENALFGEDVVGDGGGGAVGAFAEDAALDLRGVAAGDDVLRRGGDEDVALLGEDAVLVEGLGSAKAVDGSGAVLVFEEFGDVDAVGVEECAIVLADADDLVALVPEELGGVGAYVAEALDDDRGFGGDHVEVFEGLVGDDGDAAAGGLATASRAAERDGLAGDDGGDGLAHVHGVAVHDPGHGLLVGVHVGRGDVFFRADELDERGSVAAGHALELALGHVLWVADDAALGSAEGDVDDGALPGHPGGEGADFVERDVGRVADAAFGGAARDGVLDAIAGEDFDAAVVHGDGDVDDDLAGGVAQDFPDAGFEVESSGGLVEACGLREPGVGFELHRDGSSGRGGLHRWFLLCCGPASAQRGKTG